LKIDVTKGIKVGGFDYTVDVSSDASRRVNANNNFGECDMRNCTISLIAELDEAMTSKVFLHEVIEAINYIYCDQKIEHERIQQLSFGLHQVMESLGIRFGKK
jgi:hypothetical protein